jgi:hypothetical protein
MSKRIDQLSALTDDQVAEDGRLLAVGDPSDGRLYKGTQAQLKKAYSTQTHKYIAVGDEGTTITIAALSGKNIVAILRESGPLFEVDSSPDSVEYTWDGTDIVLGTAISYAGERFLILFNNLNA